MIRRSRLVLCVIPWLFTTAYAAEHIVPRDFETIQAAIDASQPGDVIHVNAGTYSEALVLKSGIRIEGAGAESTIVQCEPLKDSAIFASDVSDTSISGLTFQQLPLAGDPDRVLFPNSVVMLFNSNVLFSDCSIRDGACHGVYMSGGAPTFNNVRIENNGWSGVYVSAGEAQPEFIGCTMRNNKGSGVVLSGPDVHATARNCVMEDNEWYGIYVGKDAYVGGLGNDFTRNGMIDRDEVSYLWNTKDYTELEELAKRLRSEKSRFQSGEWQLKPFYNWLEKSGDFRSDEEEEAFLAQIDEWKAKYPDSLTWRIILADSYYDRAWDYRGSGYSNTVTQEGWRGYGQYMDKAWAVIDEAAAIPEKDPEYYLLRATLTMESPRSDSTPRSFIGALASLLMPSLVGDRERAPFLEGVALEPLYYPLYYARVRHLLPRWGGSQSEMLRFAERSADDTKELAGDTLYAVIATQVVVYEGKEDFRSYGFSWPRIQQGYEDILNAYPKSGWRLNKYCWLACVHDDRAKAAELFERLGDAWDSSVLDSQTRYEAYREWAAEGKPYPGPSPLETAIREGAYLKVVQLLDTGTDPNSTDLDGDPLLQIAIAQDEPAIFERLLEAGANPDSKDEDGKYTLEYALGQSDSEFVELLFEHQANPEPDGDATWTPLAEVVAWENYEYVKPLLDAGANPDGGTRYPGGPLDQATRNGRADVVRVLIGHGADVNLKLPDQSSILTTAVELKNVEIAKILLDAGADPNLASTQGWTPLFAAADVGDLELAKLLVEHGADVNAKEFDGWSVFHMATMSGATPVVKYLLERSPEGALFVADVSGRTLLHQAAKSGYLDLARIYVDCGVDVNAVETESGKTALDYAVEGNHRAIAELLREHGAE